MFFNIYYRISKLFYQFTNEELNNSDKNITELNFKF